MNDRKARGSAAARRRTKSRASQRPGCDSHGSGARTTRRDRNELSTGDNQLSDDIAQEHQAQVNQLRDEPVPSSHHDDRHQDADERNAGQE
jgi:hypothetical protein